MKAARHKRTNVVSFHLYEVLRVVRLIQTESRTVARSWGKGELFNRYRASDLQNRVLGMGVGDGCTTQWMYLMPLNHMLKNG